MKKSNIIIIILSILLTIFMTIFVTMFILESEKAYNVTFVLNNGQDNITMKVVKDSIIQPPKIIHNDGYELEGWYLNDIKYDFSSKVNNDITLIAKWKKENISSKWIITLDLGDGNRQQITMLDGSIIGDIMAPTRYNYIFTGWYMDNKKLDNNLIITGNWTLHAEWKKNDSVKNEVIKKYTVTFRSNSETQITNQIIKKGDLIKKPNDPEKKGHTFVGWHLDGKLYDFKSPVNKDLELIGIWIKKSFTIIFDSAGGSTIETQKVEYGSKVIVPEKPTRENYSFIEWQLDGKLYNFDDIVTKDLKITAKWKKENYSKGELVTIGGEQFYVIGTSNIYGKGVELLLFAKYTLGPNYRQSPVDNPVQFSTNTGWGSYEKFIKIKNYLGETQKYIIEYEKYLNSVTNNNIEFISVIDKDTINSLGCTPTGPVSGGTYGHIVLSGQQYWIGTTVGDPDMILVADGKSCSRININRLHYSSFSGVRPVISIYANNL